VITAIVGFLIGLPAVRLSGHFLAIATLAFGLAIPEIMLKWEGLTGGFAGLFIEKPSLFSSDTSFYYFTIVIALIITWLILNLLKGNFGRAFIAIRESEIAAEAMGVNVSLYKTLMFSISAFFTGIAGSLYAYFVGFISPHDFNMNISLIVLAMIVLGGLASISGSILGAFILTIIPQVADRFPGYTITITGAALILTILFLPNGLISLFNYKWKRKKTENKQLSLEG
jgi:branched-chain amino acid transport system permease protein